MLVYAMIAALLALVTGSIPGTSIILTGLEIYMAYHIAKRYGVHLALGEIGWLAATIYGAGLLLKLAVSILLEFVPVIGWFIAKPVVAFLAVIVLGGMANLYFKDRQKLMGKG